MKRLLIRASEVRCLVKLQWKNTLIELFHSAIKKSKVAAALPVLHGKFVRYATSSSSCEATERQTVMCAYFPAYLLRFN